jgi:NADH dehydrogenase
LKERVLMAGEHARRRRVVIVGGGFAGFHAARALSRHAMGLDVEVVLINPTDYFLYLPLLPEVAAGILDPRRVTVPLAATLPRVRLVLGTVDGVALGARRVEFLDPEGQRRTVAYDSAEAFAAGEVAQVTDMVARLTGRPPRTFVEFAHDLVAAA